uniref:Tc1-like transposase DDE domain-containing protein n=1 Tax=Acrobeloides nanus TaxID=290746 RepID=A0A914BZL4_9BILA
MKQDEDAFVEHPYSDDPDEIDKEEIITGTKICDCPQPGCFLESFIDESWVYEQMGEVKGWAIRGLNPVAVQQKGYSPCLPVPAHHGKRAIIISALTEFGIVPETTFVGLGGFTSDGDYHKTMTSEIYENWFQELVSKTAQHFQGRNIVFTMDNASYHTRTIFSKEVEGKKPIKKADIQAWLSKHKVPYLKTDTVEVLKRLMKEAIKELGLDRLVVDEICQNASITYGITIKLLRLPPYHSNLNPIELFWGQMKTHLRKTLRPEHKIETVMIMRRIFVKAFLRKQQQKP